MMCNNCKENNSNTQTGGNTQIFNSSQMANFPNIFESVTSGDDITKDDPGQTAEMLLESGEYRVKFRSSIDNSEQMDAFTLKNFDVDVPYQNEFKRVRIFKMDSVPVSETERIVTVKFALIDNPVWLAPVLWTLPAVGSWFVVDKVERFTEKSPVSFGLIMLTAISALAVFALK